MRALPVDGSPVFTYKEVTVIWGDWAVTSLFLSILFDQGDKCNNEHAKSEKLCPCNHCDHPLAFVWGCQKFTPERGNRLPWHGSATNRITLNLPIVNTSAGICRCGVFLPVLLPPPPPGSGFFDPALRTIRNVIQHNGPDKQQFAASNPCFLGFFVDTSGKWWYNKRIIGAA